MEREQGPFATTAMVARGRKVARAQRRLVWPARGPAVLLLAILLSGCAVAAPRAASAPGASARATPGAPAATPAGAGGTGVVAAPERTQAAIRQVIERGNAEQVQAIATHDSSVMADTSTSRYYQELVRTNQQLLDGGVVRIQLVKLEWGPITVNGTTATATTYETWRTVYADGVTDEARDRNVYTLVWDGSTWRIDADEHPDETPAASGTPSTGRTSPAPPEPRAPEPQLPAGQSTSTNWSGYAATGGTYTGVSGTWIVPQGSVDGSFGAGATWVGIGGVRSRDLIQAGTQEVVSGSGRVSYQAWIETLPEASQPVPLAVAPGDSVTVSITEQDPDTWLITLVNNTTGQRYQRTVSYHSSRSSAEWIEEAPSVGRRGVVPLDNFGSVQFTNGSAIKDGKTVTIAQAGARPISMVARGQVLASPSPLGSDGASFSIQRAASTQTSPAGSNGAPAPDQGLLPRSLRRGFGF